MTKEKFLAHFKNKSQSKDETDCIQITNVLTSVTEEEMQKTYKRPKNIKSKFLRRLRKKLTCMQEILLEQLKKSPLNIRNILLSEPQLTPGRRTAMMVLDRYQENWNTQPVRLWYAKES